MTVCLNAFSFNLPCLLTLMILNWPIVMKMSESGCHFLPSLSTFLNTKHKNFTVVPQFSILFYISAFSV